MFSQALRIDLLAAETPRAYQARAERLRQRFDANPSAQTSPCTLVIDDIQAAPQLLDVVHSLLEERPGLRFVLTGTSPRKLRHGAANLLGGRLVTASMTPFMASELGSAFDLDRALAIGLVPLIWQASAQRRSKGWRWKPWWYTTCARTASCGARAAASASGAPVQTWRWIMWCKAAICSG